MLCCQGRESLAGNDRNENIMNDRTTELEIKVAHLEQAIQELSDTIYAQQTGIETLTRSCELLRQRMMSLETTGEQDAGDERPPHY